MRRRQRPRFDCQRLTKNTTNPIAARPAPMRSCAGLSCREASKNPRRIRTTPTTTATHGRKSRRGFGRRVWKRRGVSVVSSSSAIRPASSCSTASDRTSCNETLSVVSSGVAHRPPIQSSDAKASSSASNTSRPSVCKRVVLTPKTKRTAGCACPLPHGEGGQVSQTPTPGRTNA
jgi:hypothetical protein